MSGPAVGFHPATLALVTSVARLAESETARAAPGGGGAAAIGGGADPGRISGRALAVDAHGWTAAVTGMPPVDRLPLPKSLRAGRIWLPSLGMCTVEPLPGGWLLRVDDEKPGTEPPSRVVLDLSRPRRWSVSVSGAHGQLGTGAEPAPRRAAVRSWPCTGTAAALPSWPADLFGDPTRTVTVRAEMSRVRRHLSGVLAHRPYRFSEDVDVEVIAPARPADLLPHSKAPAVLDARRPPVSE